MSGTTFEIVIDHNRLTLSNEMQSKMMLGTPALQPHYKAQQELQTTYECRWTSARANE
ncbi:hypothetical protein ACJMK2_044471, partial [Sinanodonta woodiana]